MSALALRLRTFAVRAPRRLPRALLWLVLWAGLAACAFFFAVALPRSPMLAFFPLMAAVGLVMVVRTPLAVLLVLTVTTGFYVTFTVELPLPGSIYALMAAALLALWIGVLYARAARHAPDRVRLWPGLWLVLLVGLGSLGWVVVEGDFAQSLAYYRTTWWFLLAALLIALAPWRRFDDHFARILIVSCLAAGAYALVRWQIGPSAAEEAFARRVGGGFTAFDGEVRAIGGVGDTHGLAMLTGSTVPFLLAMALGGRGGWRALAALAGGMCAATVVITDVRSGMLGSAAGIFVVLLLMFAARPLGSSRLAAALVGVLLIAGGVGAAVAIKGSGLDEGSKRFQAILQPQSDESFQIRRNLWREALDDIDDAPLGHGIGTASAEGRGQQRFITSATSDVGSSYLKIAYEQGFAWMVLFAATLAVLLLGLVREALLGADRQRSLFAIGAAGTLVSFAIVLNFESVYFEIGAALLIWMIVGLGLRSATLRPARGRPAT